MEGTNFESENKKVMELITYKTNIRSEARACRLARRLNHLLGSANWQLDTSSPEHYLTIFSPGIINEAQVHSAIRHAGVRVVRVETILSNS